MSLRESRTDVLIAGAGPVGLALAIELGLRSVQCIVVEQHDRVGYNPRAKLTNVRSREILRRWGIADELRRASECGDPHHGFARIYCDGCGHDYLLAYSCKTRYFCPSCHQKRVLLYGDWVEANVLEPVPHRQYVFTLPKLLRPVFGRHRTWLGELIRVSYGALDGVKQDVRSNDNHPGRSAGMIVVG